MQEQIRVLEQQNRHLHRMNDRLRSGDDASAAAIVDSRVVQISDESPLYANVVGELEECAYELMECRQLEGMTREFRTVNIVERLHKWTQALVVDAQGLTTRDILERTWTTDASTQTESEEIPCASVAVQVDDIALKEQLAKCQQAVTHHMAHIEHLQSELKDCLAREQRMKCESQAQTDKWQEQEKQRRLLLLEFQKTSKHLQYEWIQRRVRLSKAL